MNIFLPRLPFPDENYQTLRYLIYRGLDKQSNIKQEYFRL